MEEAQMMELLEHYSQKVGQEDGKIKITRIPDRKTVFIEQIDGSGRAILLDEYTVFGKIYWAGYSLDSQTVYVSQTA